MEAEVPEVGAASSASMNDDMLEAEIQNAMEERNRVHPVGEVVDLVPDGGVTKKILVAGSGEKPPARSHVKVHYVGTLDDGKEFDSSRKRDTPFEFDLGTGAVIKAWDIGVAEMRVGEKAVIRATSDYAYGDHGSPPTIPAKATLTFEVEMLDYEAAAPAPQTTQEKIDAAVEFRAKGNEFYRDKNFAGALTQYNKAVDLLEGMWGLAKDEDEAVSKAKVPCHLNLCQVYLKKEDYSSAFIHANKVLDLDDVNVKALYRKGVAEHRLGRYPDAVASLEEALVRDPKNREIVAELARVRKSVRTYKARERKMMQRMLGGLQDVEKTEKPVPPEQAEQVEQVDQAEALVEPAKIDEDKREEDAEEVKEA